MAAAARATSKKRIISAKIPDCLLAFNDRISFNLCLSLSLYFSLTINPFVKSIFDLSEGKRGFGHKIAFEKLIFGDSLRSNAIIRGIIRGGGGVVGFFEYLESNRFLYFFYLLMNLLVLLRFVTDKVLSVNFWLILLILVGKNRRVFFLMLQKGELQPNTVIIECKFVSFSIVMFMHLCEIRKNLRNNMQKGIFKARIL